MSNKKYSFDPMVLKILDIQAILPTHEAVNLYKLHGDRVKSLKIVDLLLIVNY